MVSNATISGFSQTSSTGYTFMINPTLSGAVTVSVGSGMAMDTAGNMNTTSNTLNYTYSIVDTVDPVVMITSHMNGDDVT